MSNIPEIRNGNEGSIGIAMPGLGCEKAVGMVRTLFAYYLDHPGQIPAEYLAAPGDVATHVADYIAGMTDRYALRMYEQLFLPQRWLL